MAVVMANLRSLVVNAVDLSDHVQLCVVTMNAEQLDGTAMGQESRAWVAGLRDDHIEVTFFQDYAAAKVDATLNALVGGAAVTIVAKPTNAAVSATNPSYTMSGSPFDYQPITGTVGELATVDVTFLPAPGSKITRAIA